VGSHIQHITKTQKGRRAFHALRALLSFDGPKKKNLKNFASDCAGGVLESRPLLASAKTLRRLRVDGFQDQATFLNEEFQEMEKRGALPPAGWILLIDGL